jgi:hypothetical protein
MQKLELKSIYILCRNCSSSYTERNKIGFEIFGFFYDFILNLQITGSRGKSWKNLLALGPLELSKPYKQTLGFYTQTLENNSPSQSYPPAAEQARRRRGWAGGGKQVRGMSDWTHVWPIRGGGSSGEGVRRWPMAKQWQHGRRGSGSGEKPAMLGHQVRLEAHVWAREELRVTGWSRVQAGVRVCRRR